MNAITIKLLVNKSAFHHHCYQSLIQAQLFFQGIKFYWELCGGCMKSRQALKTFFPHAIILTLIRPKTSNKVTEQNCVIRRLLGKEGLHFYLRLICSEADLQATKLSSYFLIIKGKVNKAIFIHFPTESYQLWTSF